MAKVKVGEETLTSKTRASDNADIKVELKGKGRKIRHIFRDKSNKENECPEILLLAKEPEIKLSVYAGVTDERRATTLIRNCIMAGAAEISFFAGSKSASKNKRSMSEYLPLWQAVAHTAATEFKRSRTPHIKYYNEFTDMLDSAVKKDAAIFLQERGDNRCSMATAASEMGNISSVAIISGGEEGFSEAEMKIAEYVGFQAVSLGEEIIRNDYAPAIATQELLAILSIN